MAKAIFPRQLAGVELGPGVNAGVLVLVGVAVGICVGGTGVIVGSSVAVGASVAVGSSVVGGSSVVVGSSGAIVREGRGLAPSVSRGSGVGVGRGVEVAVGDKLPPSVDCVLAGLTLGLVGVIGVSVASPGVIIGSGGIGVEVAIRDGSCIRVGGVPIGVLGGVSTPVV